MPSFNHRGIKISYETIGEGAPLLLVNGLGSDTRSWEPLLNELKGSFQIVSYDMRCAGRSDKPDAPFSIEDLAEESHALMLHLGHEKFFLLGFSMGGMVAMRLALDHPESIQKLFLVSTAPSLKRPHPPAEETLKTFRRTDVSPELLTAVYECIFGSAWRKKVSPQDFIAFRMQDDNPQPTFAYRRQMAALESCDLCNEVQKISIPTAIIVGSDDHLIPPENSQWLKDHLSHAMLFTFEGVGHMVPIEAPDRLAGLLRSGC